MNVRRCFEQLLIAGACAVCASAAAQNAAPPPKTVDASELEPLAENACLVVREVRSFDALDDSHVFVAGRRDDSYLLTMSSGCIGLRSAFGIAIESRQSRVCSTSSADVRYRGPSGRSETCRIRRVEAVEDKLSAQRLVELRAK